MKFYTKDNSEIQEPRVKLSLSYTEQGKVNLYGEVDGHVQLLMSFKDGMFIRNPDITLKGIITVNLTTNLNGANESAAAQGAIIIH